MTGDETWNQCRTFAYFDDHHGKRDPICCENYVVSRKQNIQENFSLEPGLRQPGVGSAAINQRAQSTIRTEADYLQAHLTAILRQSRLTKPTFLNSRVFQVRVTYRPNGNSPKHVSAAAQAARAPLSGDRLLGWHEACALIQ